jgi:hypothetical protein
MVLNAPFNIISVITMRRSRGKKKIIPTYLPLLSHLSRVFHGHNLKKTSRSGIKFRGYFGLTHYYLINVFVHGETHKLKRSM